MNGLPPDFDASFIAGSTIIQICVGANEVILRFAEDIDIVIECDVDISMPTRSISTGSAAEIATAFMGMLPQRVISARGSVSGDLTLVMDDLALTIHDSSPEYESYQIRHGEDLIVV